MPRSRGVGQNMPGARSNRQGCQAAARRAIYPNRRTLLVFLLCGVLGVHSVAAQQIPNTVDTEDAFETGYLPTPPELIPKLPQTRTYRDFLPTSVDLRRHLPPPGAQGKHGSCVGWAVGYSARGYYSSAAEGLPITRRENIPSPSYIYNLALSQRGVADCKNGMRIIDAFRILENGSPSMAEMPYDDSSCGAPTEEVRKLANKFQIREWRHINPRNLDTIKGELVQGHPVVFGMMLFKDFLRHRGETTYRASSDEVLDSKKGHAMTIVGYDEARQAIRVVNSWGTKWGEGGFAWIDYDTFRQRAREAYVMRPRGRDPQVAVLPPTPKLEPAPPIRNPQVTVRPPMPKLEPTRPGDLTDLVRDLALECAKVVLVSEGGKQRVRGFVAKPEDAERVRERMKDRAIGVELDVRPWPQCEALLTLDRPLAAEDRPTVTIRGAPKTLMKGDQLVIDIISSRGPAHLHVAYIQADGTVVHLVQADAKNLQTVDGGRKFVFGDGLEGRQRFRVRSPFGSELVLVLASRSPLFPEVRPQSETEREFLTALRKAMLWKVNASEPDRVISAAMTAVMTTEN